MSFLNRLLATDATPGPIDDFWYGPVDGVMSTAGMRVGSEGARKVSAWYRGRDILATSLAMLPLQLFERLSNDDGANVARGHPLYDVIHRKPNGWQDSFGWRRQKMYHLIDYGNAYDRIVPGVRGFADELHPIHPTLVTPEKLKSGAKVFHIRDAKTGQSTTYGQDVIWHLCGASDDGVVGKGILEFAKDSVGTALATESYAARIFSKGTLNGGTIANPGLLNPDAAKRMAASFITSVGNWHMPKVLEQGSTFTPNLLTPENAQMLLSRKFSIDDIARWLGMPPHMIGSLDRSTNNNIEQQGYEFVTYSLGPWLSLFEFGINDELILATQKYYAEFTRDALVRGDIAVRWEAYTKAVSTGIVTRNEVRRKENMNRLDGLDEPLDPTHLTGKPGATDPGTPAPKKKAAPPPADDNQDGEPDDSSASRARAIATESSARLLRKETAAAQRAAVKYASDVAAWETWVHDFYEEHSELVAASMVLDEATARFYCETQRDALLSGLAAMDAWTPAYLVGLALDRPRPSAWQLQAELMAKQSHTFNVHGGPVTIAKDAITATVHGAPVTVTPGPTSVTIEKGAIQHEAHTHLTPSNKTIVKKKVARDAKGQITSVTEEHEEK